VVNLNAKYSYVRADVDVWKAALEAKHKLQDGEYIYKKLCFNYKQAKQKQGIRFFYFALFILGLIYFF